MTRANTRLSTLLGLMLMPIALIAQPDPGSDTDEPYCPVSSEEIVAGASDQGATLGTAECTERFRRFVSETVGEVRRSYRLLFEDLRADPKMIDALSRLIAREQLLSTGWVSLSEKSMISHGQSASDPMLLQETNTLLQERLTQEDFALFQKYKKSLPTRELVEPVIARLQAAGMPPSRAQLERAVEDVQSWAAGLMRAHDDGGDEVVYCEQADAFMSRREAQLLAILSKSLDEEQASVARAYYRERTEQREKELASAGHAPCKIHRSSRP